MNELYFLERRKALITAIEEGVVILSSSFIKTRSNDTEFPFRQNSDFYYLTGFEESNALLVMTKTRESVKTILFLEDEDEEHALWNGERLGVKRARERFQMDEIRDIKEYTDSLGEILKEHIALYIDLFDESHYLQEAIKSVKALRETRGVKRHIRSFHDVTHIIRSMRLIKSEIEVDQIRLALAITAKAHHEAMKRCQAGMVEYELQAHMNYLFLSNGAKAEAYGAIVAGGNNANTLHYINNNALLNDGDLVLIDAACEWNLYASDITRTFPVNGKFTPAQREVYDKVLDVQLKVIDAMKPGVKRDWLQKYSEELLAQALIDLKIISGDVQSVLESKSHKKYAPHGIGHWMGLDVHDPCPYVDDAGESLVFKPGMVMTIEPGLYIRSDDMSVEEKYRGIGIRIEDDILITEQGCENLSSMIVKRAEDIEAMCADQL